MIGFLFFFKKHLYLVFDILDTLGRGNLLKLMSQRYARRYEDHDYFVDRVLYFEIFGHKLICLVGQH